MKINKNKLLTSRLVIHFLYRFIRLYSWTFRLKVENENQWMEHIESGGRILFCTWHQHFFSFIRYFKKYKVFYPSLMISQSSDGEIIAGVANLTGWQTIRGSSSKDGKKALHEMIQSLASGKLAAHIVDGPRGPAGIVKKGAITLAQEADAMIVPIYAIAKKAWYFQSWDRFFIPKPFSKVVIRYGSMIKVTKTDDADFFENQRKGLEEIMLPALNM